MKIRLKNNKGHFYPIYFYLIFVPIVKAYDVFQSL